MSSTVEKSRAVREGVEAHRERPEVFSRSVVTDQNGTRARTTPSGLVVIEHPQRIEQGILGATYGTDPPRPPPPEPCPDVSALWCGCCRWPSGQVTRTAGSKCAADHGERDDAPVTLGEAPTGRVPR